MGALVIHHPTPSSLTEDLPGGLSDPGLHVWALAWGWRNLLTPWRLFDGPIYWPAPDTLAYSDPLTPLAPFYGVVHAVTGNWALTMNLLAIGLTVLAIVGTYALVRWLTGRADAGLVAGFAFTLCAYTQSHRPLMQLQVLGLLPLALLLLFRLLDERRLRDAVLLGLLTPALALCSLYYGAAWALTALVILLGHLAAVRFRPDPGLLRGLAVSAGLTAVLLAPVGAVYLRAQDAEGLRREAVPEYSLGIRDLLTPAIGNWLWGDALDGLGAGDRPGEHAAFPGLVTAGLALAGLVALARRPMERRRYVVLTVAAGGVLTLFALGPERSGIPLPYAALHDVVPGVDSIRITARFWVVGMLAVAVLAGVGWAWLAPELPRLATAGVLALIVVEGMGASVRERVPDGDRLAVYRELDRRPNGPTVELPIVDPRAGAAWNVVEGTRMMLSTLDFHPRVNGFSGYYPRRYLADVEALQADPVGGAEDLGVRYLVLHLGEEQGIAAYDEAEARAILRHLPDGANASHHGSAWLVDLGPS